MKKEREKKAIIKMNNKKLKPVGQKIINALRVLLACYFIFVGGVVAYNVVTPKLDTPRIEYSLKYYGGNSDYLGKDMFDYGYRKFSPLDTKNIKVGLSNNVTDSQKQQFEYFYNYLNKVFNVVNPNYHFNLCDVSDPSKCDVFIDFKSFKGNDACPKNAAAVTYNQDYLLDLHKINKSTIYFNSDMDLSDVQLRFFLAHEMMHTLTGSKDVGMGTNLPATLFGYDCSNRVVDYISTYHEYDAEFNQKVKDEFISYMPYDLSAIISLYGNIKDETNKNNCTELLHKTLELCKKIYGDEVDYYPEGYVLPEYVTKDGDMSR